MVKSLFTFVCVCLFIPLVCSAKDYVVKLNNVPFHIDKAQFYISEVIDARPGKENIGIIPAGSLNIRKTVIIEGGLEKTLLEYLTISLPDKQGSIPLVLRVKELKVGVKTVAFGAYARSNADFEFYGYADGKYIKIFESTPTAKESSIFDCNKYHELNIRKMLKASVTALNYTITNNAVSSTTPAGISREELLSQEPTLAQEKEITEKINIPYYDTEWKASGELSFSYGFTGKTTLFQYTREKVTGNYPDHTNTFSYSIGYSPISNSDIDAYYSNGYSRTGKLSAQVLPFTVALHRVQKTGFFKSRWGIGLTPFIYTGDINMSPYDAVYSGTGVGLNAVLPGEFMVGSSRDDNSILRVTYEIQVPLINNKYTANGGSSIDAFTHCGLFLGVSFGKYW